MIPTYICNYKPINHRLMSIEERLKYLLLPYTIIDCEPEIGDIESFYDGSKDGWNKKCDLPHYRGTEYRPLRRAEISLAWKHYQIYKDIVSKKIPVAIILEDDINIDNDLSRFAHCLNQAVWGWDVVFLGGCCPMKYDLGRQTIWKRNLVKQGSPASRCTDGYILTLEAAKKLLTTLTPICLPIDWELSYHFEINKMVVYHLENPIIHHNPQLASSIQI